MSKFNITKKSILAFFISFILMFIAASISHAQTSSSSGELTAKKYAVSFPVAELGNCANLKECKSYCDDPINQEACLIFAKKKGFYKEDKSAVKTITLRSAKQELGCDSEDSCRSFCGTWENWQKCGEFAKKHNLGGGQTEDPAKKEILSKAKEVLGCGSYEECKGFCTKEENRQKCDEFAKLVGLRGGTEKKGPGGCTSLETCKIFCSDPNNFQLCQGFVQAQGGQFKGLGGCDSKSSCKVYCQQHESECKQFFTTQRPQTTVDPQEYCSKTPNCKWTNNRCECQATFSTTTYDPAKKCLEYGCSWTNNSCTCFGTSAFSSPYPTFTPYPQPSYSPYATYSPYPSTTNTTCQPPSSGCGQYYYFDTTSCSCKSYEDYCKSKSGCNWTNNNCVCSATVQAPSPYPTSSTTDQPK